jgi:hypothetical protein
MLTLYAQGLFTGVVVDSGDGVTHIVAVYDGFCPENLTRRLNVAGRHITRYLIKLMMLRGYAFNRSADLDTVRDLKETHAYVAYDIDQERALARDTTVLEERYRLPDTRVITIGRERFEAPEALFTPALVDCDTPGIADLVFDSVQSAEMDIRKDLMKHVVLSGGSTMYPGLPSRLERDLKYRYLERIFKGDIQRMQVRACARPAWHQTDSSSPLRSAVWICESKTRRAASTPSLWAPPCSVTSCVTRPRSSGSPRASTWRRAQTGRRAPCGLLAVSPAPLDTQQQQRRRRRRRRLVCVRARARVCVRE